MMEEVAKFNPFSQTAYFVRSRYKETEVSSGTAFFVIRNGQYFLITNWHVVSSRNSENHKCISPTGAIPNNLIVKMHKNQDDIDFEDLQVPLEGEAGERIWLEHPVHTHKVDVVAIKVDIPPHLMALDLERFIEPYNESTRESVSDDVFILGYPFGMNVENIFPIWKRGSIASEPCIDIDGLPKILVDTASRPGMSGSPVILYQKRSVSILDGDPGTPGVRGSTHLMRLVGVYSGRIGAEGDDTNIKAHLGIVWKQRVIKEIISHEPSIE